MREERSPEHEEVQMPKSKKRKKTLDASDPKMKRASNYKFDGPITKVVAKFVDTNKRGACPLRQIVTQIIKETSNEDAVVLLLQFFTKINFNARAAHHRALY